MQHCNIVLLKCSPVETFPKGATSISIAFNKGIDGRIDIIEDSDAIVNQGSQVRQHISNQSVFLGLVSIEERLKGCKHIVKSFQFGGEALDVYGCLFDILNEDICYFANLDSIPHDGQRLGGDGQRIHF